MCGDEAEKRTGEQRNMKWQWADGATMFIPGSVLGRASCGDLVKVRPCAEKYGGRTYLGLLIGEVAQTVFPKYDEDSNTVTATPAGHNPMIFIPETRSVVFGYESWWGRIESVEELGQITDEDIDNIWYVQVLRRMMAEEESDGK